MKEIDKKELLLTDEEIDKAWEDKVIVGNLAEDILFHTKLVSQAQLDKVLNHPAIITGLKLWDMIPEGKWCDGCSFIRYYDCHPDDCIVTYKDLKVMRDKDGRHLIKHPDCPKYKEKE